MLVDMDFSLFLNKNESTESTKVVERVADSISGNQ